MKDNGYFSWKGDEEKNMEWGNAQGDGLVN